MSEIRKVKCDRCGLQEDLIGPDGDRPNGWCFIKDLDLCPSCHTAYKTQFAQMQDLFFKNDESPVMKLIKTARALTSRGVIPSTELPGIAVDIGALRAALDEIDPPVPVF